MISFFLSYVLDFFVVNVYIFVSGGTAFFKWVCQSVSQQPFVKYTFVTSCVSPILAYLATSFQSEESFYPQVTLSLVRFVKTYYRFSNI